MLSGEAPKDLGRSLNRHLELRNRARYDPHAEITPEGAKGAIELAEEMAKVLTSKLKFQYPKKGNGRKRMKH